MSDQISIHERLATLEEQGRWLAPKVEKIDEKLDVLIAEKNVRVGKSAVLNSVFGFVGLFLGWIFGRN